MRLQRVRHDLVMEQQLLNFTSEDRAKVLRNIILIINSHLGISTKYESHNDS